MGVPSDISHVMHPDGQRTPAMFVEVSADCKVHIHQLPQASRYHSGHSAVAHAKRMQACRLMQVVLLVVRALNMSPGKIGAQCAHAAVGLYKVTLANRAPWLSAWEVGNQPVLQATCCNVSCSTNRTALRHHNHCEDSFEMVVLQFRAQVRRRWS